MKAIGLALAALLLVGCNDAEQIYPQVKPHGLEDCKFYDMTVGGRSLYVVRCPNSTTTTSYMSGKVRRYVAAID